MLRENYRYNHNNNNNNIHVGSNVLLRDGVLELDTRANVNYNVVIILYRS